MWWLLQRLVRWPVSWRRVILVTGLILFCEPITSPGLPNPGNGDAFAAPVSDPVTDARTVDLLTHDLSVELIPDRHQLLATDRLALKVLTSGLERVSFSLNAALRVSRIHEQRGAASRPLSFTVQGPDAAGEVTGKDRPPSGAGGSRQDQTVQMVTVRLDRPAGAGQQLTLEWVYEGAINDPPRESRDLRYVTPSETTGHIGSEGVYLGEETHWYPDIEGALPTYRVRIVTPEGWETVTHGRQVSRLAQGRTVTADWEVTAKTQALTLVANRFVKAQRTWHDSTGDAIEVATYLFPEEASLAEGYLEASVRYLEAYSKLLGPYPFPKFAVVENFFASGLGMPSFTLLGSGVVKRHYVQPFALGHEIVHSWIGNWVLNDVTGGNWVEGLTTYLANYYYDELAGQTEQAREQRRMMLLGFAVYVRSEEDYPVGQFRHKHDQKDNAIGYQKAAMVFHMLRREIGDEAFWSGIRKLVAELGGAFASWTDLERVFGAAGGRNLRWFFAQWVEQPGAPSLRIAEAELIAEGGPQGRGVRIRARMTQDARPYRLRLPVSIKLAGGRPHAAVLEMTAPDQTFTIPVPDVPLSIQIDPDFDTFRRLAREQVPPMLNLFVTDRERSVVLPGGGTEAERAPYQEVAARLTAEKPGQDSGQRPVSVQAADRDVVAAQGSVLVLGAPGINRAVEWAARGCGKKISLGKDSFMIEGRTYEGPNMALLVSCRHPDRPESVVTLFYGLSPPAAAKVARLLFFYGWQSYLVFQDGVVVSRGDFVPPQAELEVAFDSPKGEG